MVEFAVQSIRYRRGVYGFSSGEYFSMSQALARVSFGGCVVYSYSVQFFLSGFCFSHGREGGRSIFYLLVAVVKSRLAERRWVFSATVLYCIGRAF